MVFFNLSRYPWLDVSRNSHFYSRLPAAAEHEETELDETNGSVNIANVQPVNVKKMGRLRKLKGLIKLKCIENLKRRREQKLLLETEKIAELEAIKSEEIKFAHCQKMLAISKLKLPRSR